MLRVRGQIAVCFQITCSPKCRQPMNQQYTTALNHPQKSIFYSSRHSTINARPRRASLITTAAAAALAPPPPSALFTGGWALWGCIAACAAASQLIERRTKIGVFLSAPLLATFLALGAATIGVIPTTAPAYDTIWTYIMPLAAALYLLESDISKLISSAGQSILAFFNGALGTVVGTIIAFSLVGRYLGPDGAKVAAALCAR